MAQQVPYSPVPDVSPSAQPEPFQRLDVNPNQFGAGIGQATEKLGATITEAHKEQFAQQQHFAEIANETWANTAVTGGAKEIGDAQDEYRQLEGMDRVAALPDYQKRVQDIQDKYAQTARSPAARLNFLTQFRGYADRALVSMGTLAGNAAETARDGALQGAINTAQASALRNHGLVDNTPDIEAVVTASANLAHAKGWGKDQADAEVQKNVGIVYQNLAAARIAEGDTAGARALLDKAANQTIPGTDLPIMNRQTQLAMIQEVDRRETFDQNHAEVEAQRQQRIEDKQKKAASDAAADVFVQHLITNPASISNAAIAASPLEWRDKEAIARARDYWLKKDAEDGSKASAQYGPGYYKAYQAINPTPGTDATITDARQLWELMSRGDLTPAGVNELTGVLKGLERPDSATDAKLESTFYEGIKQTFTAVNPQSGIKDPKGAEQFTTWFAHASQAIKAGLKAGKTMAQLVDAKSPDYVGKTVPAVRRTDKEVMDDYLQSALPGGAVPAPAPKPDRAGALTVPADVKAKKITQEEGKRRLLAAHSAGLISTEELRSLAISGGYVAPAAH